MRMIEATGKLLGLLITISLLLTPGAFANWFPDGIAVWSGTASSSQVVSDGEGGAIATWSAWKKEGEVYRYDIYARRVTGSGTFPWVAVGVCTETNHQYIPDIASDGGGGAIITWEDWRSGVAVYAQRVDSAGTLRWTAGGVLLCTAAGSESTPKLTDDGSGGAIIVWSDNRKGDADIYAQRVNADGVVQWDPEGVPICTLAANQVMPQICSDGEGGAIIVWEDYPPGGFNDLYAQRVSQSGTALWTPNGVPACNADGWQDDHVVIEDGTGGALVTWYDHQIVEAVHAQRLNPSGIQLWPSQGVIVSANTNVAPYPDLTTDGAAGAIIAWRDRRSGTNQTYAQWVDSAGVAQWTTGGVVVCGHTLGQGEPRIASDGVGGAIIAWSDVRNAPDDGDIYAQRMDSLGTAVWTTDGVAVCLAVDQQMDVGIVPDGAGGAVIIWEDLRGMGRNIYAQRLDPWGDIVSVEEPAPGEDPAPGVGAFVLGQSYPNPFNPVCTIRFEVVCPGPVGLRVFDVRGALVRTLFEGWREPAAYSEVWDGRDDRGRDLPSGVYFYQLEAGGVVGARKVVLLR